MNLTLLDRELLYIFYKRKGHMIYKKAKDNVSMTKIHLLSTYSDAKQIKSRDKLLFYGYLKVNHGYEITIKGSWISFRNGI